MKPVKGDVVRYNGIEYVVTEVGLRWGKGYSKEFGSPEHTEMIPLSLITKTGERIA